MTLGVHTKKAPPRVIFLPEDKVLGRSVYTTRQDVLDFLAALEPGAPDKLIERFSR